MTNMEPLTQIRAAIKSDISFCKSLISILKLRATPEIVMPLLEQRINLLEDLMADYMTELPPISNQALDIKPTEQ